MYADGCERVVGVGVVCDAKAATLAGLVDYRRIEAEEGARRTTVEEPAEKPPPVRVEYLEERHDIVWSAVHPEGRVADVATAGDARLLHNPGKVIRRLGRASNTALELQDLGAADAEDRGLAGVVGDRKASRLLKVACVGREPAHAGVEVLGA